MIGLRCLWMDSEHTYGGVPNLNFNPNNRKVNINYYNPDNANDNLGSRISLGSLFLKFLAVECFSIAFLIG